MGSDDNFAIESRFRFLQNQLTQLGYQQSFSTDSLPLVEFLVADLLQTTDTLKHYKDLSKGCLQACHELETFVDAYKKDNARLLGELNSLNLNTITDKASYEKRILDLEHEIQIQRGQTASFKHCSKTQLCKKESSKSYVNEKYNHLTKIIQNKDNEIKQLYCEISRLNNLLSGGKPIDVLFKAEQHKRKFNALSCCAIPNTSKLQQDLINAIHGQHEAKCNAVKFVAHCDKSLEEQQNKLHHEVTELKTACNTLEDIKSQLQKEIRQLKRSNEELELTNKKLQQEILELNRLNQENKAEKSAKERELETVNLKLEKELLEYKRSEQEKQAERSDSVNQLKKCLEEKKHLSNRIQELSAIEKDLTIEISRLSNINAIHKRHILELENKLLDVHQNKNREKLTSKLDLLISKKPIEKRPISNRTSSAPKLLRTKKSINGQNTDEVKDSETKSSMIVSEIREKYQKQLDSIQGNDNDLLSFIKRLEEETNLSVESSKAIQRQLETQLESTIKQLELLENQKINVEKELNILRDKQMFLEEQVSYKDARITHLEQISANYQKQTNSSTINSARSEESSRKAMLELERLRIQVKDLENMKDTLQTDNRKLQNDLAVLTQDYVACKNELEKAKKEAQDGRIQVHDYIAKVRAAEETLQQKDKERCEMLDHFRTLTIEATQLESNNQSLESEARSTRNLLRDAESKILDLEHMIQNKDALINGYEDQLNELTKTIAGMETKISNLTVQRDRYKSNSESYEEMRSQVHSERDNLYALEEELCRLQNENQRLQEGISKEKINVATLERLLSDTRNNKIEHNLSISELQEEIHGLKANIKCLQESLETLNRKLRQSQNEAADYQRQVIQLNRDLTNLQFDRIRNSTNDTINYSTL